jgi:hypothetical protein
LRSSGFEGSESKVYRITPSRAGGLRLAVFEGGLEVAGAVAPTRSEEDRLWLEGIAFELGAMEPMDEGGANAKSTP